MTTENYFLLTKVDRHVIVHAKTGFRVNVFASDTNDFEPANGELHVFGDNKGNWLVFETEGWTDGNLVMVTGAVMWYSRYVGYPQMKIFSKDPRQLSQLRKIE